MFILVDAGLFLSAEEIEQLTGYKRKSDQCKRLRDMHIAFHTNRLGVPVVNRCFFEHPHHESPSRIGMPDLDAMRKLANGKD